MAPDLESKLLTKDQILATPDSAVSAIEEELRHPEVFIVREIALANIARQLALANIARQITLDDVARQLALANIARQITLDDILNKHAYLMTCVNNIILGLWNEYGKALGGSRLEAYIGRGPDFETRFEYAKHDCKNLASEMTLKFAILYFMGTLMRDKGEISTKELRSLLMGGGKSVIFFDDLNDYDNLGEEQQKIFWRDEFGKHVDNLGGIYVAGADVRTNEKIMTWISEKTGYVCCHIGGQEREGMIKGTGDPSGVTALGVYYSMEKLADLIYKGLNGLTIGIEGTGKVGRELALMIREKNPDANIYLSDIDHEKAVKVKEELLTYEGKGEVIVLDGPEEMFSKKRLQEMHILSPNAGSETLNEKTVEEIIKYGGENGKLGLVLGGANCQFQRDKYGKIIEYLPQKLHKKGIFVPTGYPFNSGGILSITEGMPERVVSDGLVDSKRLIKGNSYLAEWIYRESMKKNLPPYLVAENICHKVIAAWKPVMLHAV